jgi:hypothetical protein
MGRRGPAKQKGNREASGRLSRRNVDVVARVLETVDREDRENLSVGIEARIRRGVNPAHSRDQMAGSVIGRWCLSGTVSRVQFDAATLWLGNRAGYLVAISAPREPGAVDPNAESRGGVNNFENVERSKARIAKHRAAEKAIRERQIELRLNGNLFGAIDTVLVRDVELMHLAGDVRECLNALVRHYGLNGARRAA